MMKFFKNIIKGIIDLRHDTQRLSGDCYVTNETIQLIKKFEGFRKNAYQDVAGIWTIGYGNTEYTNKSKVKEGDVITRSDAEILLSDTVAEYASAICEFIKSELNDQQFGALVSFTYNVGITAFKRSTLLRKLNSDPMDPAIANEFGRWVKAGGKTVSGLIKRRKEESDFYFGKQLQ